MIKVI